MLQCLFLRPNSPVEPFLIKKRSPLHFYGRRRLKRKIEPVY